MTSIVIKDEVMYVPTMYPPRYVEKHYDAVYITLNSIQEAVNFINKINRAKLILLEKEEKRRIEFNDKLVNYNNKSFFYKLNNSMPSFERTVETKALEFINDVCKDKYALQAELIPKDVYLCINSLTQTKGN